MSRRITYIFIVLALVVLVTAVLPAQAYIYAGKRKNVYCGVIAVSGVTQPLGQGYSGGVGDLFYMLDQRTDLKPGGWNFENPLAPGSAATGLSKRDPAYWIVNISEYRDLSKMHVLYLPASGEVRLTPLDREKLRQFVDGGGVLWIDNAFDSSEFDFRDTFFITKFRFNRVLGPSGFDAPVNRHHPLLTMPFWLSDSDVASLGRAVDPSWNKCECQPGYDLTGSGYGNDQPFNFDVLYPIVNNTSNSHPSIAANAYGSGRIVATSNFVGGGCFLGYPFNMPSLKFAYNVIAWSSSWTHIRKDPRHSGRSIDTIGASKLLESWSLEEVSSNADAFSAPIIYKNVAFHSVGSTLYALDIDPQEDLDQDGWWDDGYQGTAGVSGNGLDVIWEWQNPDGAVLSSPTLVTGHDPRDPTSSIEAVLVMSGNCNVYVLPAFPCDNNRVLLPSGQAPIMPPWQASDTSTTAPSPPLYVNGWIYAVGGDGGLHAYNPTLEAWDKLHPPSTAKFTWDVPGKGLSRTCTPKGGLAFGFVKNDSNGAVIGMVYWYGNAWPSGGSTTTIVQKNDYVRGAPVFISNDRLKVERSSPTAQLTECRISFKGELCKIPVPVVQYGGVTHTDVVANSRLNPAGDGIVTDVNNYRDWLVIKNVVLPQDAVVYGTYAIDYAVTGSLFSSPPMDRYLEPSVSGTSPVPGTLIVGVPALGPDNMMYLTGHREEEVGDSIYGLRNDGSLQTTRWNFQMHGGVDPASFGVSAPIQVPAVVFDEGKTDSNGNPLQLKSPKIYSSPAVADGKVFATVTGISGLPGPSAALLCFKAISDFVIRVTENAGYDINGNPVRRPKSLINTTTGNPMAVKIWQPDLMTNGTQLPPSSGASDIRNIPGMLDADHGTITFNNFDRPKIKGNMIMETNTFTPSLPVWVYVDNAEVPIDWKTWAPAVRWAAANNTPLPPSPGDAVDLSGWNNLLWYYIVPDHGATPCMGIHSSPIVIGSTVYFTCDDGILFALPTDVGGNTSGQMKAKPIWTQQIASSGSGTMNTSVAGSNGVLLVPARDGLHAFSNATTLVTDASRVIEIDSSGEASWSVESISWPAALPNIKVAPTDALAMPPRLTSSVNKPARAKNCGPGEILVVNTGANQVCKIDKSGMVSFERIGNSDKWIRWMWDQFSDPKKLLRPGQSTRLNAPTDAIFWRGWESGKMVIHCLIADSGNHRIVDLVYKINFKDHYPDSLGSTETDSATGYCLPELNWVTKTDSMNERYVYENLQLVPEIPELGMPQDVWAAVSNYRAGTDGGKVVQGQGIGGAVVAIAYRTPTGTTNDVWDYSSDPSGQAIAACDSASWGGQIRSIANPRYFQVVQRKGSNTQPSGKYLLVCDNYGVYEAGPLSGTTAPPVVRFLTDQGYRELPRPVIRDCDGGIESNNQPLGAPLVASSVQELPNGNWLVANSFSGLNVKQTKNFTGEVFEIKWEGANNDVPTIPWCSPSIVWDCAYGPDKKTVTGVVLPDGWNQRVEKSYALQQPRFAYR